MRKKRATRRTGPIDLLTIIMGLLLLTTTGCAHQVAAAAPAAAPAPVTKPAVVMKLSAEITTDYTIGAGDVLEISVWKNQDLSRQVVVLPDGTIDFPLVGRFTAGGKTVAQLKAEMDKKLRHYVPDPDLTVIVQQVNSMVVYVIGKVTRPGNFSLNRNISVLQALSMAGGLNIFANPRNISIIRKSRKGTLIIPFDYKAVTEDNQMEENIQLQRGDVVVVR